jgi:hypothetical protein
MMGRKALCFRFSELGVGITVKGKRHLGRHHKKLLQNGSGNKRIIIHTKSFNIQGKIIYKFAKT